MRRIISLISNNPTIAIVLFVSVIISGLLTVNAGKPVNIDIPITASTPPSTQNTLGYQGETGKDALTLLKAHAQIAQDNSGLVTTINGRKADNKKHEYWAFYTNGKLSSVGPAEYKTNSSDRLEWKIERY